MLNMSNIINQIETPAYVFSAGEFRARASQAKNVLGSDIDICYSIKANPFLLTMLPEEFSAVEVCSPGELRICMELGIKPEMIIYSGLNKGSEDISIALEYGVGIITAESLLHLDMINSAASKNGTKAKILVRASAGSQFGIDRHKLPAILAGYDRYPFIDFVGLHFFTGTQKQRAREIVKELSFLERYITELRDTSGLKLPRIEYGAGLPAYMFYEEDFDSLEDAYLAELNLLREIDEPLKQLSEKANLTVEMGRFFAASCGHYFTKVVDVKTNDGINYAIIDGGSHQIRYFGQMQGMQIPFMNLIKADSKTVIAADATSVLKPCPSTPPTAKNWTVCGSLCTTADVLARNVYVDERGMSIGDIIAMHQAGAYSLYECMSLFLSRDMPSIYTLDEKARLTCARDRIETDLLNRLQK